MNWYKRIQKAERQNFFLNNDILKVLHLQSIFNFKVTSNFTRVSVLNTNLTV